MTKERNGGALAEGLHRYRVYTEPSLVPVETQKRPKAWDKNSARSIPTASEVQNIMGAKTAQSFIIPPVKKIKNAAGDFEELTTTQLLEIANNNIFAVAQAMAKAEKKAARDEKKAKKKAKKDKRELRASMARRKKAAKKAKKKGKLSTGEVVFGGLLGAAALTGAVVAGNVVTKQLSL